MCLVLPYIRSASEFGFHAREGRPRFGAREGALHHLEDVALLHHDAPALRIGEFPGEAHMAEQDIGGIVAGIAGNGRMPGEPAPP